MNPTAGQLRTYRFTVEFTGHEPDPATIARHVRAGADAIEEGIFTEGVILSDLASYPAVYRFTSEPQAISTDASSSR